MKKINQNGTSSPEEQNFGRNLFIILGLLLMLLLVLWLMQQSKKQASPVIGLIEILPLIEA